MANCACARSSATAAAAAQEAYLAPGASYSAAVVSPQGATLAVLGGISGAGSTEEAAFSTALSRVATRLDEVGLDRAQILRVRAALAPGLDFDAWNAAWTTFFAGNTPPARTTVYSSGLPGDASVVLDVVAMFPVGAGHPVHVDNARETLNPNLRLAGPVSNPTAIVSTRAGLFLSSGALPGRNLDNPASLESHVRSSLNSLGRTLANHGLRWHDVFFIRAMPTPQPDRPAPDFAAWAPVYETLGELTSGNAPPYTLWAAPGFSATNRFSEIEVWAVAPAPAAVFGVPDLTGQNPSLRMSGSPRRLHRQRREHCAERRAGLAVGRRGAGRHSARRGVGGRRRDHEGARDRTGRHAGRRGRVAGVSSRGGQRRR